VGNFGDSHVAYLSASEVLHTSARAISWSPAGRRYRTACGDVQPRVTSRRAPSPPERLGFKNARRGTRGGWAGASNAEEHIGLCPPFQRAQMPPCLKRACHALGPAGGRVEFSTKRASGLQAWFAQHKAAECQYPAGRGNAERHFTPNIECAENARCRREHYGCINELCRRGSDERLPRVTQE
jgi:hypothetical protein